MVDKPNWICSAWVSTLIDFKKIKIFIVIPFFANDNIKVKKGYYISQLCDYTNHHWQDEISIWKSLIINFQHKFQG